MFVRERGNFPTFYVHILEQSAVNTLFGRALFVPTVNMYLIGYRASAVVIGVYVLVFNVSHAALRRLVAGQSTKPKRRLESSSNKTLAVINVHILV